MDINFKWQRNFSTFDAVREEFLVHPFDTVNDYDSPYDAFVDIFNEETIKVIVVEINRYAHQIIEQPNCKVSIPWLSAAEKFNPRKKPSQLHRPLVYEDTIHRPPVYEHTIHRWKSPQKETLLAELSPGVRGRYSSLEHPASKISSLPYSPLKTSTIGRNFYNVLIPQEWKQFVLRVGGQRQEKCSANCRMTISYPLQVVASSEDPSMLESLLLHVQ
ncbi:hypothetical protein EVAR_13884_1 [Eumeta japonica]|uniref:Uncharacterized protein n=1 Tax=Eumeta variegata TaxID=151549 RepID=A0A4C1U1D5_EUMVA|nr:hypothetical protein EVAR_13884_1 [Eumeta japonica]